MLCFDEQTGTRAKLGVLGVSPADPAQALSPGSGQGPWDVPTSTCRARPRRSQTRHGGCLVQNRTLWGGTGVRERSGPLCVWWEGMRAERPQLFTRKQHP